MANITITQSFEIALHDAITPDEDMAAHTSGTATSMALEPARCSETDFHYWNSGAQEVIDSARDSLDTLWLASFEPTRRFKTEGDVSDAAAVHLTNPVDLALNAQYPSQVAVYNQMTKDSARADRVYAFQGSDHCFAVMDYKAPGVKRPGEISRAVDPEKSPSFVGNLFPIIKQAVHYACVYRTRFVCFFDYNSLLLINLTDAQLGSRFPSIGGDSCQITLVSDKRRMRRALLGFLVRAYDWCTREDRKSRDGGGGASSQHPGASRSSRSAGRSLRPIR